MNAIKCDRCGVFAEVPEVTDRAPADWCTLTASLIQRAEIRESAQLCGACADLVKDLMMDPAAKVMHGG